MYLEINFIKKLEMNLSKFLPFSLVDKKELKIFFSHWENFFTLRQFSVVERTFNMFSLKLYILINF